MNSATLADKLARAQIAHPWRFLLLGLLLTVAAGVVASGLRIDSSYEALLPQDTPELRNADEVRARTGGVRQIVIVIGGAEPEQRLAFGRRLAERLRGIDRLRAVELDLPVEFFQQRALWLLPEPELEGIIDALERALRLERERSDRQGLALAAGRVRDALESGPRLMRGDGVLTSTDGRYTFLVVVPTIDFYDIDTGRALMADLQAAADALDPEAAGIDVRFAGNLPLTMEQQQTVVTDLRNASILALVLGVLVVALLTLRPLSPLLVGLSLIAGISWTFAVARVLFGHLNIITGFLVAVLIGLGIDFGIHLLVRYRQEAAATPDDLEGATRRFVGGTLPPALTGALTTAGTFFSIHFAEFRAFSEFGLIACIGVLFTLASSFLCLPPLLIVLHRFKLIRPQAPPSTAVPGMKRIPLRVAATVAILFVSLAVYGAVFVLDIPYRNDMKRLRGESPATQLLEYVNRSLGVEFNPTVMIVNDLEAARRAQELVRQVDEELAEDPEGVQIDSSLSIADLLPPPDLDERRALIDRLGQLLDAPALARAAAENEDYRSALERGRQMIEADPWTIEDVPQEFRRRFLTRDGEDLIVYIWPGESHSSDLRAQAWSEVLNRLVSQLEREGLEVQAADETLIIAWVYRLVVGDGPRLLGVAALVVFFFLLIDFRSLRHALLVATPLVIGMLGFAASLHLLGRELNMFNVIVLPSVVGIGIDNAVHIYHRYQDEGPGSLLLVVRRTGVAALLASLTTAVGFGSSLVSHHLGLQSLGMLAILGICATFLSAVVFFPCLLSLLERWNEARRSS